MSVRDRLITTTIALIRSRGVAGTGIADLLAHSGVARRSIYLNFPGGKSDLVAAATVTAGRAIGDAIDASATTAQDPVTPIKAFFALWIQALLDSDYTAGCPIVAATLARAEAPDAAERAGDAFTDWVIRLTRHLETHGVAPPQAAQIATTFVAAVEGAVVMSIATKNTTPLHHAEATLTALVRDAIAATAYPSA